MNGPAPLRIGLIGLGNAGGALLAALNTVHSVALYDRDPARLAGQGNACGSAADLARQCGIVILSLPTPDASLAVAADMAPALSPGSIVLETSTVGPEDIAALQSVVAPSGARVIDAAIVGGVSDLAAGRGLFLVGSPRADAGPVADLLNAIAEDTHFLPQPGDGMRMKLVVNAVAHAVFVVLAEAGALTAAQGLPLDVLESLLLRRSGLVRPLTHRFAQRLRGHDFSGGMSTANALKDSRLIIDVASRIGVPLFAIPAAHKVYETAISEGLAASDYAVIGTLWEKWCGIDFAADQDDG